MNRTMRSALAAIAVALLATGIVSAGSQPSVSAGFAYSPTTDDGPTRSVTVHASGGAVVGGTYRWTNLLSGTTRTGTITCMVIDGSDAWLAGPETRTDGVPAAGAFFHFADGGTPGIANDLAVAWIGDPGQSLDELLAWCADQNSDVSLFDIDGGNLTVRP
jgi:hypothetical protein